MNMRSVLLIVMGILLVGLMVVGGSTCAKPRLKYSGGGEGGGIHLTTTDTFEVEEKFRITVTVEPDNYDWALMEMYVYREDPEFADKKDYPESHLLHTCIKQCLLTITSEKSDTTKAFDIQKGPGRYFINFNPVNLDKWEIEIEIDDYESAPPEESKLHQAFLADVWGSSSIDVFVVGSVGHTPENEDVIFHYDGSTWSEMYSGTTGCPYSIWGSSSSDVFAVGRKGVILHYDGSTWSSMSSGTTERLKGVWGSSSTDVFAVGSYPALILHYDGSAWSPMNSGTAMWLEGIWGSSSSDVFAVGDETIVHYDGSTWESMDCSDKSGLLAVWGSSSSDVFAVGAYGIILHYDGSTWSVMSSGTAESLKAVWGSSSSDVFAVGWDGTILHYDGNTWSEMSNPTPEILWGVWGSSSSDVFAVGAGGGTILHYDGSTWSEM